MSGCPSTLDCCTGTTEQNTD